jgi:hypothetical protein
VCEFRLEFLSYLKKKKKKKKRIFLKVPTSITGDLPVAILSANGPLCGLQIPYLDKSPYSSLESIVIRVYIMIINKNNILNEMEKKENKEFDTASICE